MLQYLVTCVFLLDRCAWRYYIAALLEFGPFKTIKTKKTVLIRREDTANFLRGGFSVN